MADETFTERQRREVFELLDIPGRRTRTRKPSKRDFSPERVSRILIEGREEEEGPEFAEAVRGARRIILKRGKSSRNKDREVVRGLLSNKQQ